MRKCQLCALLAIVPALAACGAPPDVTSPTNPDTTIVHAPVHDSVWDINTRGFPRIVSTDYIELPKIARISLFRSSAGHDYHDSFESCLSMKHYFVPASNSIAPTIEIC